MRIAARRGYEGTTLAQVVRATGLPASSIYWHFRSKDELLAEVLEYSYRQSEAVTPIQERVTDGPWHLWLYDRFSQLRLRLTERPEYLYLGLMLALERHRGRSRARNRFLSIRIEARDMMAGRWRRVLGAEAVAARPWLPTTLAGLEMVSTDGLFLAELTDDHWDLDALLWMLAHGIEAVAHRLLAEPADAVPLRPAGGCAAAGSAFIRAAAERRGRCRDGETPGAGGTPDDGDDRLSGRERILLAAAEVAAEHGYQGTTISRVCRRAGLPGSSVYWFFKDKDELLAAVVQHSYERWRAGRSPHSPVPPGVSWAEALRERNLANWAALGDNPNFLRLGLLLLLERRESSPTGRDIFQGIRRHTLALNAEWFSRALPAPLIAERPTLPDHLAQLMMALSDGLLISLQIDRPAWVPRRFADLAITILEAGTRCPPVAPRPPLDDQVPAG